MRLPTLDTVLQYQNPAVLKLYKQNYPNNKLAAEDAFREALKYLWLTQHHLHSLKSGVADLPQRCVMLRSMREIDEMWHEFILFTKDYMDFCQNYFGTYIHHLPNLFDNMPVSEEEANEEIEKLLPYIFDYLGEETMRIWFADYLTDA